MACFCGDTECPSCGTYQGTLADPPEYLCANCGAEMEQVYIGNTRSYAMWCECGSTTPAEQPEPESEFGSGWFVSTSGFERCAILSQTQDTPHGLRLEIQTRAQASRWVHPFLVQRTSYDAETLRDFARRDYAAGMAESVEAAAIAIVEARLRGTGD